MGGVQNKICMIYLIQITILDLEHYWVYCETRKVLVMMKTFIKHINIGLPILIHSEYRRSHSGSGLLCLGKAKVLPKVILREMIRWLSGDPSGDLHRYRFCGKQGSTVYLLSPANINFIE
jgi:hypothetical protein